MNFLLNMMKLIKKDETVFNEKELEKIFKKFSQEAYNNSS